MDQFGNYIGLILRRVSISQEQKQEIEEEMRDHLEMLTLEYLHKGMMRNQAEIMAMDQFGKNTEINKNFKRVFNPYRRWKNYMDQKKYLKIALQWTAMLMGALLLSLSVRSYAFASTEVRQCSMQNTLFEGQRLIENKIQYHFAKPQRGDIVIINQDMKKGFVNIFLDNTREFIEGFYKQGDEIGSRLVKRIIGVPGDQIDIRDGNVYINGALYDESYVVGETAPFQTTFPITIPEHEYFVMGDNRENSMDSRDFGLIDQTEIEGKAVWRLWPLNNLGSIY